MAETQSQTATETISAESEETPTPNRMQSFVINHPRISKIAAVTGAVAAAVGVVTIARTVQSNKGHLENAADHASAGLGELAATVDPASPEA